MNHVPRSGRQQRGSYVPSPRQPLLARGREAASSKDDRSRLGSIAPADRSTAAAVAEGKRAKSATSRSEPDGRGAKVEIERIGPVKSSEMIRRWRADKGGRVVCPVAAAAVRTRDGSSPAPRRAAAGGPKEGRRRADGGAGSSADRASSSRSVAANLDLCSRSRVLRRPSTPCQRRSERSPIELHPFPPFEQTLPRSALPARPFSDSRRRRAV
ncbi:hypothetical protein KM043_000926 [Ampulex compressa]|nr:hypothetical protein KM043_000926 [Ampulex compressa]